MRGNVHRTGPHSVILLASPFGHVSITLGLVQLRLSGTYVITTTPLSSAFVSVNFSFGTLAPISSNKRRPVPTTRGKIEKWYSSIKPCSMSVRSKEPVPYLTMSLPGCAFNLRTASAASPGSNVEFHVVSFRVLDETNFGRLLIFSK